MFRRRARERAASAASPDHSGGSARPAADGALVDGSATPAQPATSDWTGNPLDAYFTANPGRLMQKWVHYLDIYHRHFQDFRGRPVTVVEFGVSHGGSLQMWKHYFGPRARVIGIDIKTRCATLAEPQIEVMIGDQGDRTFLRQLADDIGGMDVVIDDGGHTMEQQIGTFEELWPSVVDGGVFLTEDTHTSYRPEYGGGYRRPDTFVEFAKSIVDQQNGWHSTEPELFEVDDYTRTVRGLHFYDSVVVFDKARIPRPHAVRTGTPSF